MKPLSKRQYAALQAIIKLSEDHGYPPTVREIMKEIELTSSSTVQVLLDKLEAKGYIKREGKTPRALTVLIRA
ncbi:hypothetical protein GCM10010912_17300 [Paenibacillus albidus]|uniref:LexA repressor DNA-binding domain-containing protein n=1 Tax=Paenibacillus albidus TaxID=2041023 RepID=A0A917C7J8_9BACL|nr:hypothetical protein GCM10010912_17300 [Paenibacillus albidus]